MLQKIKKLPLALWLRVSVGITLLFVVTLSLTPQATAQVLLPNYGLMLSASSGAVLAAKLADDSAQNYFNGNARIGKLSLLGNKVLGGSVPGLLMGTAFIAGGYFADQPYEVRAGIAQVESLLVTWAVVSLIKSTSNRERPNGKDHYSFPSAHTAYAFTAATVLNEFYGWKIGVPAYILGALTAAARMQDNQHWFSDTVGGAAIAVLISTTISRWNLKAYEERQKQNTPTVGLDRFIPQLAPDFSSGGMGLNLTWQY